MWVLDTDVLVAALRSRTGASAEIVRRVLRGECQIALSVALALEYEAVATRAEHIAASGLERADVLTVLDALIASATPVRLHFLWRPQLRNPDDDLVLEAAVNGRADAFVTFNTRHFDGAASRLGVAVLSPRQALETIR